MAQKKCLAAQHDPLDGLGDAHPRLATRSASHLRRIGFRRCVVACVAGCVVSVGAACGSDRLTQPQMPVIAASGASAAPARTTRAEFDTTGTSTGPSAIGALTTISYRTPNYLKASTGNLYWTSTAPPVIDIALSDSTRAAASSAAVYRMGKHDGPGYERTLYYEYAPIGSLVEFRGITYALVDGTWYGYFVACYRQVVSRASSCVIKRVPLAGGSATVLTPFFADASGPLETDSTYLYWPDARGIRRMPIRGGAITTLVDFAGGPGTASISLTSGYLYYAYDAAVRRVPKTGGAVSVVATGAGINHVYARETLGRFPPALETTVYWIEANARVRSQVVGSPLFTLPLSYGSAGRVGTSVGHDGVGVMWADCAVTPFSRTLSDCSVRKGIGTAVLIVDSHAADAGALQWDASAMYFRAPALMKYTY